MNDFKAKLENQLKQTQEYLNLLQQFPDLRETTDRWKNIRLVSKAINTICTHAEVHGSCGCCSDAVMYAYPYAIINNHKIYAEGAPFIIGEKYNYSPEAAPNWKDRLEAENIGLQAMQFIEQFINTWKRAEESNDE